MTPDEFAQHLTTQPWAPAYIYNVLSYRNKHVSEIGNYISGLFSWAYTREGMAFWVSISSEKYDAADHTYGDLLSILPSYFPNNPEFLSRSHSW